MNKALIALGGFGVGAGVMYLADPSEGRRRRARLRDFTVHVSHTVTDVAGMTSRDVEHRLTGLAARTLGSFVEETPPPDEVLAARVRARLGRLVSHPGAIEVNANHGVVKVSGPIFEAEVEQLTEGVAGLPGVSAVENRLEPHAHAEHVPALQGPGPLEISLVPASWRQWTPTMRLIAGVAGLALVALSVPNRTTRGAATGIAGLELLERAVLGARGGA